MKFTKKNSAILNKIKGFTVSIVHYLIVMLSFILGIFSNDWFTLSVVTFNLLVILSLNLYIQDCPLTKIENDYLGTGITNLFMKFYYRDKINEKTKYIVQTGAIIFMLSLICLKGLVLLFKRNLKNFLVYLDNV
tara:strand:+ start:2776 stop:3177 length:402 start_codon:yes stop_codon:yes gene_type:complete